MPFWHLAAGTDATVLRLRRLGADAVGEMVAASPGDTPQSRLGHTASGAHATTLGCATASRSRSSA